MADSGIDRNAHLRQLHQDLSVHTSDAERQIEQVTSGLRVNRASDDPASVAIADGIRTEMRSVTEGNRNIQQSIHMLQTADGSLQHITAMIRRMQALAVQSASSTYNPNSNRLSIHNEFQALRDEIDRLAESTTFNDLPLLASDQVFTIQAGPTEVGGDLARIQLQDMRASGRRLNLSQSSLSDQNSAATTLTQLDSALDAVLGMRGNIGAFQNRLERHIATGESILVQMADAESAVRNVDVARAMATYTRSQILSQTAVSQAIGGDLDVDRILALLG